MTKPSLASLLIWAAALILLATAAFHASGHAYVSEEVAKSEMTPFLKSAIPTIWLFFSWHVVVIALFALGGSFLRGAAVRHVLVGCGVVTAIDFVWVVSIVGLFAGSVMLLAASACLLGAAMTSGAART